MLCTKNYIKLGAHSDVAQSAMRLSGNVNADHDRSPLLWYRQTR